MRYWWALPLFVMGSAAVAEDDTSQDVTAPAVADVRRARPPMC